MSEAVQIAALLVLVGAIGAVATGLYNHVRECRRVHYRLGRIEKALGIEGD